MNKREAFEALQSAIRTYNDALDDFQSSASFLSEVGEVYDFEDVEYLEVPSEFDLPDSSDLESAIRELENAVDDFNDATSRFNVVFIVSVETDAEDEDAAKAKAERVIAGLNAEEGVSVHVEDVEAI